MRTNSAALLIALLTACGTGEGKLESQDDANPDSDTDTNPDSGDPGDDGEDPETLVDRMDVDRLLGHLDALQAIADGELLRMVAK